MPPPLVLLPGVMGSRLFFPNNDIFWDPDDSFRMLSWVPIPVFRTADVLRLRLHHAEPAEVLTGPLGRGWDGVPMSFYQPFLEAFSTGPTARPVYAIGYDWRQDLWVTADFIRARIDAILAETGAAEVDLVTHSMGGLVTRAMLARSDDVRHRVRRVVHVCQPVFGAVVLYRRFFTGLIPHLDGGFGPSDVVFRLILGGDAVDFAGKMSGLPGPVQLLPAGAYPLDPQGQSWLPFPVGTGTLYDLYGMPPRPPFLTPDGVAPDVIDAMVDRLAETRALHARLNAPPVVFPDTWSIYGTGLSTDVAIGFDGTSPVPVIRSDGDGTVPVLSGSGLFPGVGVPLPGAIDPATQKQFLVEGVTHGDAMKSADVIACTRAILG